MATFSGETLLQIDRQVFAASFSQEGLWFLDQLEPGSAINTLTATVEVSSALLPRVLETSLNLLVERHEILRTTLRMREGQLVQVIAPRLHIPLRVTDLRALSQAEQQEQAQRLATQQAQLPFVLSQGPLLRCTLLHLTSEQSVLLLHLHRIVCDDWSVALLVRELACLYDACAAGHPSSLPPLPMQYAQVVAWQREWLQGEAAAAELAYWKQRLAGSPAGLDLPGDRPRLAVPSYRGAMHSLALPKALSEAVRELSRREGVSLEMTLVAAWQSLLYRYTGQEDLVIGMVTTGRLRVKSEGVIGLFENILALRSDLAGDPSFRAVLGRVREVMLGAQAHQELPFEALVKELHPTRALGHNPLFQVLLILAPPRPALPPGWTLSQVEVETGTSRFDLSLRVEERAEGLLARFQYSSDLFDEATIARLAGHWQRLLEGIAANPNQPLSALPLLREQERHQLLVEWNATRVAYPQEKVLHQLFEIQVERTPEAVAVVCEGERLSYQKLNARANHLAHQLQEAGVMPESLVALLLERGVNFIAAILAVFKTGGAFLPLDPEHPVARRTQIVQQSGCQLVLTSEAYGTELEDALGEVCAGSQRARVIPIEALLQQSTVAKNLPLRSGPGNLAYIMYTSGSTGAPKGVMVEQGGMVNHIFAKLADLDISRQDRVAQNGPPCFNIVVWQCLAALVVGGSVYVFRDEIAHDPLRLLEQLEEKQITILQAVPSILRAVAQQAELLGEKRPRLADLRWVVPTGDALSPELCRQWLKLYPAIPLLNTYGSTECSDDQCHYVISQPPGVDYPLAIMSIGRPIQNMRTYILDAQLQPVPVGVVGDLYIGGRGVGRGYLHDAQRTAEVFLPDPFGPQAGGRLYKTRDRARYLPDGNIEFLGRSDNLVKVHGLRIEPGEIEALLEQHAGVREAVVVARENRGRNKYLVAYVVPVQDEPSSSEELRSWLRGKLPEYMVPGAFMFLESLPLNANGKVERRALPAPELSRKTAEESYVAPRHLVEQQLVQIWEELLGVRPIGIKDDFFELGGDSLLAVRLFDRMAQVCGKKLALATLFAGATIEQVAKALGEETQTQTRAPLVVVQAGGSRRPFFFLHGQWTGGALYSRELAHHLGPEQPFYLLEPYKFDGLAVPPTLEEMAAAHLETLRSVQPEGPYLLGGWCNGGLVAYEMARQLHAQGQTVDLLVLMDSDAPAPKFEQDRRIIDGLCNLLRLSKEKQVDWFLLYRHLRLSFHHWRLNKFKHAGTTHRDELEPGVADEVSPQLDAIIPRREVLRQDWLSIYDWAAAGYMPYSYPGKITFFWTEEEPLRREGWFKLIEAKLIEDKKEDIHIIPGNHITSRTKYLSVLAEHLSTCLSKVHE